MKILISTDTSSILNYGILEKNNIEYILSRKSLFEDTTLNNYLEEIFLKDIEKRKNLTYAETKQLKQEFDVIYKKYEHLE